MQRPRISIAGLMVVVLAVAVGMAGLRFASPEWSGGMLTATLGLLGVGILGTCFRKGSRRAFWAGFSLFGWGYLIVSVGPWFASEIEPNLITRQGLAVLHAFMHEGREFDRATVTVGSNAPFQTIQNKLADLKSRGIDNVKLKMSSDPNSAMSTLILTANFADFMRIGHCLFALIAGGIGGMIAAQFHKAEERLSCPDAAH